MAQGIQEQIGVLPSIEPKLHLGEIRGKMFCADSMPRSYDASLQKTESVFDCVGVDVSINVYAIFVSDGLVFRFELPHSGGVRSEFVSNDCLNVFRDIVLNECGKCPNAHIPSMEKSYITAALPDTENDLLFAFGMAGFVLVASLPRSDVGFIDLDGAVERGLLYFVHGSADSMAEIPRCFVAHADRALDLIRRDSFTCFAEKKSDYEPLCQSEMGIIEDRSSGDRELVIAVRAPKQFHVGREAHNFLSPAARALWAIWPAQTFKQFAALFIGRKTISNFRESHREHPV